MPRGREVEKVVCSGTCTCTVRVCTTCTRSTHTPVRLQTSNAPKMFYVLQIKFLVNGETGFNFIFNGARGAFKKEMFKHMCCPVVHVCVNGLIV